MNSIVKNHFEEMNSRLNEINEKFYEKSNEINEIYQELENIGYSDHILQKFCDIHVNTKAETFHNDNALIGAKYKKNMESKNSFSRTRCRDLKEILRFSRKENITNSINKEKYEDFVKKMENQFEKTQIAEIKVLEY